MHQVGGVTLWLSASLWIPCWRGLTETMSKDFFFVFFFTQLESSATIQPAHPHACPLIPPELSTRILSPGNTARPCSFVQRSHW